MKRNIFDSDEYTLYYLDEFMQGENIEKLKYKLPYLVRYLKEKLIMLIIKIQLPFIYFSYNFQINDTITMYLFNHRVMYFTRYGKIVHKKKTPKISLEEFFGCKGGLCK